VTSIAYETFGDYGRPPVVLVMGSLCHPPYTIAALAALGEHDRDPQAQVLR